MRRIIADVFFKQLPQLGKCFSPLGGGKEAEKATRSLIQETTKYIYSGSLEADWATEQILKELGETPRQTEALDWHPYLTIS